ncbi:rab-3A-interacting protein isoform X1 [Anguilla anguilla]|uniref:rab-3A-interacting protein isoform X1 n=1 Tax=Anguilla anguilla TaxID=7936 RepID=UPI0015A82F1D|nr:rab-3A-interacting protein isoform X1 [Anguilla anguilla]
MASEPLEGFHEVNLASPTTPDLHGLADQRAPKHAALLGARYRAHSGGACPPNTLRADQLPTQPVYSTPGHLGNKEPHNGSVPGLDVQASSSGSAPSAASAQPEAESGEGGAMSTGEGEEPVGLSRLRSPSVMEVREKGYERLKEELAKAQRELKLKDEECERLSKVRDQLGQELEELTASLFEEAHKMVREANVKQATAEKQLKEALGKIDVLQAEVAALKTLVLSTSPTSPSKELSLGPKAPFKKGHARNKSTSSAILGSQQELSITQPIVRDCKEVDTLLFGEFKTWKEEPTLERSCSFLDRVYKEDIYPCLTFSKCELASAILEAVERNTLSVEPVGFQPLPVVKASAVECGGPNGRRSEIVTKCALSGQTKTCKHRIKFGDSSNYYYVSPFCRYRITSVCNFFTYIRYIHQGLVKQQDAEQMFWEVMQLRKEMSFAKLGFYREEV